MDGELAALFNTRFELDSSLESARKALEAGRRYRLRGVETMALVFVAEVDAYRQDRPALERSLAELARAGGADPFCSVAAWESRAIASLLDEDRRRATSELEQAMTVARSLPVAAPGPVHALWALLRTADAADDAAQARQELRVSWSMVNLTNRGYLAFADAIDFGRRGLPDQAADTFAAGERLLAPAPWYFHYGRRLVAEAAIDHAWGEPAAWLRQSESFFEENGYRAVASACRSLLRKCGESGSRRRAHRGVPEPFRGHGVTEREMEVLTILVDGLSNKDIGARLYLSPKTVEKHVASLMDKLEVRTRTQLAALTTAHLGDAPDRTWGKSPM